jgi:hypothetical protein
MGVGSLPSLIPTPIKTLSKRTLKMDQLEEKTIVPKERRRVVLTTLRDHRRTVTTLAGVIEVDVAAVITEEV